MSERSHTDTADVAKVIVRAVSAIT